LPRCEHKSCEARDRLWMKKNIEKVTPTMESGLVERHYYCKKCGTVHYTGSDRAKEIGFYANVLGDLRDYLDKESKKKGSGLKITTVQIRLIMKELEVDEDFTDSYWKPFDLQKREFVRVMKRHLPNFPKSFFEQFLSPGHEEDVDHRRQKQSKDPGKKKENYEDRDFLIENEYLSREEFFKKYGYEPGEMDDEII